MGNKEWKKVSKRVLKLAPGQNFEGIFKRVIPRETQDNVTGEIIEVEDYIFDLGNGEEGAFTGGKGFKRAFQSAELKEGDECRIERLPNLENTKGQPVGQYDILTR